MRRGPEPVSSPDACGGRSPRSAAQRPGVFPGRRALVQDQVVARNALPRHPTLRPGPPVRCAAFELLREDAVGELKPLARLLAGARRRDPDGKRSRASCRAGGTGAGGTTTAATDILERIFSMLMATRSAGGPSPESITDLSGLPGELARPVRLRRLRDPGEGFGPASTGYFPMADSPESITPVGPVG